MNASPLPTKVAFVTPWFGFDIPGGMESETRRTAVHLSRAGYEVEILTTCIRDFFADWGRNHHQPGVERINGLTVRRFAVQKRNKAAFDRVNAQLMRGQIVSPPEAEVYLQEMIKSPDLYRFIEANCQEYVFFFIPYMFATTVFGAQICPERTAVIPCLHDESYAYLDIYRQTLPQTRALVLHTQAERQLADRLFGDNGQPRPVIGEGVDVDFLADGGRFRQKHGLKEPFLLYVGRRDAGKNTPLLIDYWTRYAQERGDGMKLVLLGPGQVRLSPAQARHVVDLGFVPVQDKYDAYATALALCQPSLNESFSLVLMESWLAGTPAIVHGGCAVTREHCRRSNGGLYFSHFAEFAAVVDYLRTYEEAREQMGRNGRAYVLDNYQWPAVIARYQRIIADIAGEETTRAAVHHEG